MGGEHDDGERDASEGNTYSPPWPMPFESDADLQARRENYDKGYYHTAGQNDENAGSLDRSVSTSKFLESGASDAIREEAYKAGRQNARDHPHGDSSPSDSERAESETSTSGDGANGAGGGGSGISTSGGSGHTGFDVSAPGTRRRAFPTILLAAAVAVVLFLGLQAVSRRAAAPLQSVSEPPVQAILVPQNDEEEGPVAVPDPVATEFHPELATPRDTTLPSVDFEADAGRKASAALDAESARFEREKAELLFEYKEDQRALTDTHLSDTVRYRAAQQWSLSTHSDNEFGYKMKMLGIAFDEDMAKILASHDVKTISICATHPKSCLNLIVWRRPQH